MLKDDSSKREKSISEILSDQKRVVLFGAGGAGRSALTFLRDRNIEVLFFCDNDPQKHGDRIGGIQVFPPEKLRNHLDEVVLISSEYSREIGLQLECYGVKAFYYFSYAFDYDRWSGQFAPEIINGSAEKIAAALDVFESSHCRKLFRNLIAFRLTSDPTLLDVSDFEEYFHPRVLPSQGDVIIDAGAWTGDTALSFSRQLNDQCRIYSFEPGLSSFRELQKNVDDAGLQRVITPIALGLWRDHRTLNFNASAENSMHFRVDETGENRIRVTSLDKFVSENDIRPDLIKMDIEGAEFEALKGARNTLRKSSPKLQICVYHEPEDLWRIPLLIREINPDYRFYLGVHRQNFIDTILYAAGR
jgi:FkbM family methyltransferase